MLTFDTRALDARAIVVDGLLTEDDPVWAEDDSRPAAGVRVTGRLSSAGHNRYFWSGRIEGTTGAECRRCLASVVQTVSEEVQALFVAAEEDEVDDPDVYHLDSRTGVLDLRPAVREQWLLVVPTFALCRDDCQGLCSVCGADRNTTPCDCVPATDERWAALRGLRADRT